MAVNKNAVIFTSIIAAIVLIGVIIVYFLTSNSIPENTDRQEQTIPQEIQNCLELGCSENTKYVGSINSDKYYTCDCRFAKQVNPENIICFSSGTEASSQGYIKSDC